MHRTRQATRGSLKMRTGLALAGAMALGLASCGGSGGPEALTLVQGSGAAKNAALGAPEGASSDRAMGSMAMWNVEYKVSGTLPDLGDSARAWKLKSVKSSSVLAKARKVATELGVTDKFVAGAPDKSSYTAGSTDGVKPNMWLYTGGRESSWSYFAGNAAMAMPVETACVGTDGEKGEVSCTDPAVEVKPPKNLPSTREALARVTEVIESSGESADDFTMKATKDNWGTYVQANMKIDGVDSPYAWWFGFGADKTLTSASGVFASFERGAKYPLVSVADAVDRLNSQGFGYGLLGASRSSDMIVGTEPATKPAPEDSAELPEPTVITITGARLSLSSAYLADGNVVVLPAYTFTNSDGDVGTVYAVEDKYLKFDDGSDTPAPPPGDTVVKPEPGDDGSGSSSGSSGSTGGGTGSKGDSDGSNVPIKGGGGVDPSSPGDDGTVIDEPIPQDLADKLVGLTEEAAMDMVKQEGWIARVSERDGEQYMLTADYVTNRVNLTIDRGVVTGVTVG